METVNKCIESRFVDEKSKLICNNLVLLNKTGNYKYLINAHKLCGIHSDEAHDQRLHFQKLVDAGKKLILYGLGEEVEAQTELAKKQTGSIGYLYYPFITEIEWTCCCDRRYEEYAKTGYLNKRVISPKELKDKYADAVVVIGVRAKYDEIKQDLVKGGVPEENIECLKFGATVCYEERQYFEDFMSPEKEDIFIDGGCYRADSIEAFINWNSQYGYEKIISFEPDAQNYELCQSKLSAMGWSNVEIYHSGLGELKQKQKFIANGDDSSLFSAEGEEEVMIDTIDDVVKNSNVSFIKLDVEGFELEALRGAQQTIRRCHPKMAVCLYHKKEDILEIPAFIASLWEGYRFYLRIYSNAYCEVVLYAVPEIRDEK